MCTREYGIKNTVFDERLRWPILHTYTVMVLGRALNDFRATNES